MALIPIMSKFSFYQQIRILLRKWRNEKTQDASLLNENMQIVSALSLEAPQGEIVRLEQATPDAPVRVTAWRNGLTGAMGALPVAYSEWMTERLYRYSDQSAKAFIDIFGHRLYCLDYLAWQKNHLYALTESQFQPPLQTIVFALTGQLTTADKSGLGSPAPLFSSSVLSLVNLECWLEQKFGIPAIITPFTGGWCDVPDADRCLLGGTQQSLGMAPMIGNQRLERDSHFDVLLGPMSSIQSRRFLPENHDWQVLQDCIRNYVGPAINFSIQLSVSNTDEPPCSSDRRALGRGLCLGTEPVPAVYYIHLPAQGI